jgi:hypothetical protein
MPVQPYSRSPGRRLVKLVRILRTGPVPKYVGVENIYQHHFTFSLPVRSSPGRGRRLGTGNSAAKRQLGHGASTYCAISRPAPVGFRAFYKRTGPTSTLTRAAGRPAAPSASASEEWSGARTTQRSSASWLNSTGAAVASPDGPVS